MFTLTLWSFAKLPLRTPEPMAASPRHPGRLDRTPWVVEFVRRILGVRAAR